MSHVNWWVRYPHPKSHCRLRAAEFNNKNIYVLQISAGLCYKLGHLFFITNSGKRCYKLTQLHYYKLGQVLLQIGAAITN